MKTRVRPGERLIEARQRLDRAIEARATAPQQTPGGLHVGHKREDSALDLADLVTVADGARLLQFHVTAPRSPVVNFRKWLHRQDVPIYRRGRTLLVQRRDLRAALERG